MLKPEEAHGKAPEMARGSLGHTGVNETLVENYVGLLAAFSAPERLAIFEAILAMPDCPKEQSCVTITENRTVQAHKFDQSCALLKPTSAPPEKENSPTPPLAGWLSSRPSSPAATQPGSAALVDLCKRIEFCYQEFQRQHRKLPRLPFIDFRATQQLAAEIINYGGLSSLVDYVEHLERTFQSQVWGGFDRPERMRQHWQSYIQKKENQPASH